MHSQNKNFMHSRSRALAVTCCCITFVLGYLMGSTAPESRAKSEQALSLKSIRLDNPPKTLASPSSGKFLTPVKVRDDIGSLLQQEGLAVGVELGVQHGIFAAATLQRWTSCKRYYLVDIWAPQENYKDIANVGQAEQDKILGAAKSNLAQWSSKLVWLRMYTTEAAKQIKEALDYVYVDARHDYCGALEDIQTYWPLLKSGGIMAGHDYENAPDVLRQSGQDWSLCGNGTIHQGAVQVAVNEFFAAQGVQVVVTYREKSWNSWLARKP